MCLWRETCQLHVEERTRFVLYIYNAWIYCVCTFQSINILQTYKLFMRYVAIAYKCLYIHQCIELVVLMHIELINHSNKFATTKIVLFFKKNLNQNLLSEFIQLLEYTNKVCFS